MLSDDGKKSAINSPQNLKALQFMVDGVKNGDAPRAVTTYMEEESRRAFESGKPACVNVLTDPSVIYPRSANLA